MIIKSESELLFSKYGKTEQQEIKYKQQSWNYINYTGEHFISKIQESDSDRLPFTDYFINSGYNNLNNYKSLEIISKNKKFIKTLYPSVYHFLIDDVSKILSTVGANPEAEVIIDISNISDEMKKTGNSFYDYFIYLLEKHKINHRIINIKDFDVININNFSIIEHIEMSAEDIADVHNFFKYEISNKMVKPYKNIYLSRRKVSHVEFNSINDTDDSYFSNDVTEIERRRVDDERYLEQFFESLGFEIVYPEDFANFRDQVEMLHSVKTLVSITGSGLSNSIFMQPGTNVIEIVTPLVVRKRNNEGQLGAIKQEIHNFFKTLCFFREQVYLAVPNNNRSANDIQNFISKNPNLYNFISGLTKVV